MINATINSLLITRKNLIQNIENLTEEQLLFIPKGFNNNILWNFGHIIVSQQLLCYAKAGLPLLVPQNLVDSFRKATFPKDWENPIAFSELKALAISTIEQFKLDLEQNKFSNYEAYPTSSGFELKNIEDAILYSQHHEGYHTGVIASLKSLLN